MKTEPPHDSRPLFHPSPTLCAPEPTSGVLLISCAARNLGGLFRSRVEVIFSGDVSEPD